MKEKIDTHVSWKNIIMSLLILTCFGLPPSSNDIYFMIDYITKCGYINIIGLAQLVEENLNLND